jgi:hypothetical protein
VEVLMSTERALVALDKRLTGKEVIDEIAAAMKAAAFVFEPEDSMTLETARDLVVDDASSYARAFEILTELSDLEDRIKAHYVRFDRPLLTLTHVVRSLKNPQYEEVENVKPDLAARAGKWKVEEKRADEEAQAQQAAKADVLSRLAEAEEDPDLQQAFMEEATAVSKVQVVAEPVTIARTVPKVSGHTRTTWACVVDDVRTLVAAWFQGRCQIPDEAFLDGLQSFLDKQATQHQQHMSKAYPGTRGVSTTTAVAVRRRS